MVEKAKIGGKDYHEVERLKQPLTDEIIVICIDEDGTRYACPVSRWDEYSAPDTALSFSDAKVNNHSATSEKIKLFRSLFRGREDVYAKRYYNFKSRSGKYALACKNEWASGVCDKKAYHCGRCPNHDFLPLTDELIYKHLEGKDEYCRDVIGVYPMLEDETTYFLAVDLDGDNWRQDIKSFRAACSEFEIEAAVERSRSGNGAHVWFFFDKLVPSVTARKFGSGLLTRAMDKRHEIKFKSYDRMFPSQDTMPKGGFGNLIALPLQGRARKNGNSLFIDDDFVPFADQWGFLSHVCSITSEQLDKWISVICSHGELGELAKTGEDKPWETPKPIMLMRDDFPNTIDITLANGVYIKKDGISQKALNKIKRLGAFKNPDFYKSQAMRLSTYDKPRIIDTSWETEDYLRIPRGCLDDLRNLLSDSGVLVCINDERNTGRGIDVAFQGALRDEQPTAATAMLKHENGVLSATTAFGKTVVGAYLIAERKINALVLVHSSALLSQWKKALEQFLNINETLPEPTKKHGRKKAQTLIGQLGSGKNNLSGIVDIAIMQSLFDGDEVKELVRNYGMVICDECHHVPAVNFERILAAVDAKYVYGLTATPLRPDGHQPIIFMQCGAIRYRVDAIAQAAKSGFDYYIIPRFMATRIPEDSNLTIQEIYATLVNNSIRNGAIIKDVSSAVIEGRTPLILTERKGHAVVLANLLAGSCSNIVLLVGSDSQKQKREKLDALKRIPVTEPLVVVATGKYIGEGFDEPRLDTLFLAMPIAWKGTLAQYAGRLHRSFDGKIEVRVYDYVDVHVRVLERMYQKRLHGYAELGYQAKVGIGDEKAGIIFDGKNFFTPFSHDISEIAREAFIISPSMKRARVAGMLNLLAEPLTRKAEVIIVTRPPGDYKLSDQPKIAALISELEEAGITVITKSSIHQKYAVLDKTIVWYGSINLLAFGHSEESIMRFENYDIAGEIIDASNQS
jgi:superfamily II DNA or RNA helicase